MTTEEKNSINKLHELMTAIRAENAKFREDVTKQVNGMSEKTDKKHMPIFFEQDILRTAQTSVDECIKKVLADTYDSPLKKLIKTVVDENAIELKQIISDSFTQVIRTSEFKQSIVSAFSHKVSRTIISNNDGLFDRVSSELKQDAAFKAKMVTAVANVVEECLNNKK